MKTTIEFVDGLREEHKEVSSKIATAQFELKTLDLDITESRLLEKQVNYLKWYADTLLEMAEYALIKESRAREKDTQQVH